MGLVDKITVYISAISLVITITVLLIGLTQKVWRKRDGVIFLNIFLVDVVFSASLISLGIQNITSSTTSVATTTTTAKVPVSYVFVFSYLLSWCGQCIATINRYTTVSYPFFYKTILSRSRLYVVVAIVTTITLVCMLTSSILIGRSRSNSTLIGRSSINSHERTKNGSSCCENVLYKDIVPRFPGYLLSSALVVHVVLLLTVYTIEGWLWKTANKHHNHFHALTSSVKSSARQSFDSRESSVSFHQDEDRRGSISHHIRKRVSLTYSRSPLKAHGTPVFYLLVHLLTVVLYGSTILAHLLQVPVNVHFRRLCRAAQILCALRPVVNAGHHLSKKSLKRFLRFVRKLLQRESRELFTEYYYGQDANAKILKRREEIKLRRNSSYDQPRNL